MFPNTRHQAHLVVDEDERFAFSGSERLVADPAHLIIHCIFLLS